MSEDTEKEFRPLGDKFVTTPDVDLASCLATLGIPFRPERPFFKLKTSSGEEITHFNFGTQSEDGKFQTEHLVRCWNDTAFAAANQEHPLIYAKYALMNRKRLVDTIKREAPFVSVKRTIRGKDYTYLVRENGDTHKQLTGA